MASGWGVYKASSFQTPEQVEKIPSGGMTTEIQRENLQLKTDKAMEEKLLPADVLLTDDLMRSARQYEQRGRQVLQEWFSTNPDKPPSAEVQTEINQYFSQSETLKSKRRSIIPILEDRYQWVKEMKRTMGDNGNRPAVFEKDGVMLTQTDSKGRMLSQAALLNIWEQNPGIDLTSGKVNQFDNVGMLKDSGTFKIFVNTSLNSVDNDFNKSIDPNYTGETPGIKAFANSTDKESLTLMGDTIMNTMSPAAKSDISKEFYSKLNTSGLNSEKNLVIPLPGYRIDEVTKKPIDDSIVYDAEQTRVIRKAVTTPMDLTSDELKTMKIAQLEFIRKMIKYEIDPRIQNKEANAGGNTKTGSDGEGDKIGPWGMIWRKLVDKKESFGLTTLDSNDPFNSTKNSFIVAWQKYFPTVQSHQDYKNAVKKGKAEEDKYVYESKMRLAQGMGIPKERMKDIIDNNSAIDVSATDITTDMYKNSPFAGQDVSQMKLWIPGSNTTQNLATVNFEHNPLIINVSKIYTTNGQHSPGGGNWLAKVKLVVHEDYLKDFKFTSKDDNGKQTTIGYDKVEDNDILNKGIVSEVDVTDPATLQSLQISLKSTEQMKNITSKAGDYRIIEVYLDNNTLVERAAVNEDDIKIKQGRLKATKETY